MEAVEQEIKEMMAAVRKAYSQGKTKPIEFRIRQLKAVQRLLIENEDLFLSALISDLKKPKQESMISEIEFLKNELVMVLDNIWTWTKPKQVTKNLTVLLDNPYILSEPFGVVLVMGAWNYPVQLALSPMIGAIAAGNAVILKPSELSPATADLFSKLLPKYLDKDCYHVFNKGIPETTLLLKERFDYIFYTGSTNIGKIVSKAANEHLTPVTLELGGKSPAYVDSDLKLDVAVRRLLWGKMMNMGQTCVAPDYILCTQETSNKLIKILAKTILEYFGPNPQNSPDLGRIVNARHAERLQKCLKGSGKIAIGGEVDLKDLYIAPTVLVDVKASDPIMKEEIFGPILPIMVVDGPDQAIEYINQGEKPLTLYVFSTNNELIEKFVKNTTSGSVCANDAIVHLAVLELPFGGVGNSGTGQYHGEFSFDTFSHKKSVLIRNYNPIVESLGNSRYPPYSEKKLRFISKILKRRPNIFPACSTKVAYFFLGISTAIIGTVLMKMMDQHGVYE